MVVAAKSQIGIDEKGGAGDDVIIVAQPREDRSEALGRKVFADFDSSLLELIFSMAGTWEATVTVTEAAVVLGAPVFTTTF